MKLVLRYFQLSKACKKKFFWLIWRSLFSQSNKTKNIFAYLFTIVQTGKIVITLQYHILYQLSYEGYLLNLCNFSNKFVFTPILQQQVRILNAASSLMTPLLAQRRPLFGEEQFYTSVKFWLDHISTQNLQKTDSSKIP